MAKASLETFGLDEVGFGRLLKQRVRVYLHKPYPPVPPTREVLDRIIPLVLTLGHRRDELTGQTVLGTDLGWQADGMDGLAAALDGAFSRWDLKLRNSNKVKVTLTLTGLFTLVRAAIQRAVDSNNP